MKKYLYSFYEHALTNSLSSHYIYECNSHTVHMKVKENISLYERRLKMQNLLGVP